jgi:hypothetical protein
MEAAYAQGEVVHMGENARALIAREFSWEENARRFVSAIRSASSAVS